MSAQKTEETVTPELAAAIEAARPKITYLASHKITTVARYFIRRGWGMESDVSSITTAFNQNKGAGSDFCLVRDRTRDTLLGHDLNATVIRFWMNGFIVATGSKASEAMEMIARLRATREGEEEDGQTNYRAQFIDHPFLSR